MIHRRSRLVRQRVTLIGWSPQGHNGVVCTVGGCGVMRRVQMGGGRETEILQRGLGHPCGSDGVMRIGPANVPGRSGSNTTRFKGEKSISAETDEGGGRRDPVFLGHRAFELSHALASLVATLCACQVAPSWHPSLCAPTAGRMHGHGYRDNIHSCQRLAPATFARCLAHVSADDVL